MASDLPVAIPCVDWSAVSEEILCPLCNYNLRGLIQPRCPECGSHYAWDDLLDPRRRKHPYLFEHHPEMNWTSFWRTARGGLRPIKFWRSLHPVQPSNRRRLVLYALIILSALYLLLTIGGLVSSVDGKYRQFLEWGWPSYGSRLDRPGGPGRTRPGGHDFDPEQISPSPTPPQTRPPRGNGTPKQASNEQVKAMKKALPDLTVHR